MDKSKEYKQFLQSMSVKKNIFECLLGVDWKVKISVITFICIYLVSAFCIFQFLDNTGYSLQERIVYSLIYPVTIIFAFLLVFCILYGICFYLFVDIPVRLQSKHLPLTWEEFDKIPYKTDEEFVNFLKYCCSRKLFFEREYSNAVAPAIETMIGMYLFEHDKEIVSVEMPGDFKDYLIHNTKYHKALRLLEK